MGDLSEPSGTGSRFGHAAIILAGVAGLVATLITVVSVWLQAKNYRKPLLQRYVIRILILVPIFSVASWVSLLSLRVAFWIDPFRDVYEAFTIYFFFQLLISFIGGERALIIMMYGRKPVSHLWPLNYFLPKVDISDPHTFLAIKRGILQYTWVKPMLAVATIIMKATDTYQEGYVGLNSGYFWSGLIYNMSIAVCLYALALFWVCMSDDLQPFRPMPKFLCIKGIIFASWWQGFFLSILVWLGAIPDNGVEGYTADNLGAAIQDALICFEMPFFAVAHWYAFSWQDYADVTISAARMPVKYALRDAFGAQDLIQDTKITFAGKHYEYRHFDAHDNVLAHEDSSSRKARMREGMRYERGGKGKYWIPNPTLDHEIREPLLGSSQARTMSPGVSRSRDDSSRYGATDGEPELNPEDERLFDSARALEFGDWNYPVIEANRASHEAVLYKDPTMITSSTNRHLLQPTKVNKKRRKDRIREIQESADKHRDSVSSKDSGSKSDSRSRSKIVSASSSSSENTDRSQLVDLVVEDREAEDIERVRARKEGSAAWNEVPPKHFVRAYPDGQSEEVREEPHNPEAMHNTDVAFTIGDNNEEIGNSEETTHWQRREHDDTGDQDDGNGKQKAVYGSFAEERDVWSK